MNNRHANLVVALVLSMLLSACCAPQPTPTQSAMSTETLITEEAKPSPSEQNELHMASIREFMGQPDLEPVAQDSEQRAFGQVYQVYEAHLSGGERAQFDVNAETGEVAGFVRYSLPAQSVGIGLAEAQTTAEAFARQHYAEFDAMGLEVARAELIDHGDSSAKFYSFWWIQRDVDSGAYLPNEVKVRVNTETGQITSYASLRVTVNVSTQPSIDEQEATDLALDVMEGLQGAQVADVVLAVSTIPVHSLAAQQALLWQVVINGTADEAGYIPGAFVFIDAQSGEIVQIDPFL